MKIKIAIALAIIFGIVALIAGNPAQEKVAKDYSQEEIKTLVGQKFKAIDHYELADLIITSKANFRIFDLRNSEDFQKTSLPYAENIGLEQLKTGLFDNLERYIIISNDDLYSFEAMRILNKNGLNSVNILYGGQQGWDKIIMNPILPNNPNEDEIRDYNRKRAVAKSFGAVFEGDEEPVAIARPKSAPVAVKKAKKAGGC
ncbi:MAG: rhodanese-like domain-containing protein [Candidatus Kapabacteria bacterium]|nr:rhodanese-like domain-containing protein [Ignavibacteriota bacterium]MCW5886119.1 rhodanese-like domain-containing protein [Candidatus Kapabacteria bacterium]